MDRSKQIRKYRGKRCIVCRKWGGVEPFGEPLLGLMHRAQEVGLTLKGRDIPEADRGVHIKCLAKLKTLLNFKQVESCHPANIDHTC